MLGTIARARQRLVARVDLPVQTDLTAPTTVASNPGQAISPGRPRRGDRRAATPDHQRQAGQRGLSQLFLVARALLPGCPSAAHRHAQSTVRRCHRTAEALAAVAPSAGQRGRRVYGRYGL